MDLSQNSQMRGKNVPCCDIVKQMTQLAHDWAIVLYENCESQQSLVNLLTSSVFTYCLFVCLHGDISIYLRRVMF